MRVVIDTNVFVESLSRTSPFHAIFQSLVEACVSTSIMLEYEKVVYARHRQENADRLRDFLAISLFVITVEPTYRFNLITVDPDDNKFVNCAIAANAEHVVTSDHHFEVLKYVDFPKIHVIHPEEFIKQYLIAD